MAYEATVIERYPDGTKWMHYFSTKADAEVAIKELGSSHLGRTYELIERS